MPPQIVTLEYGFEQNRLLSPPETFVMYRGIELQVLTGVGFGPDGLYFVLMFPNRSGLSAVFKIIHDPSNEHPFLLEKELNPRILLRKRGCYGCHTIGNRGGNGGPILDKDVLVPRLEARLKSQEYFETIREVDSLDREPFLSFKEARREILEAEGLDKIRLWMTNKIQETKFDNPDAQMPNLGLSEKEAAAIADYLVEEVDESEDIVRKIEKLLPTRRRALFAGLIIGFFAGGIVAVGAVSSILFFT